MKHVTFSTSDIPSAHEIATSRIFNEGDRFFVGHGSEEVWTRKLSVDIEILHPEIRPLIGEYCPNDMKYVNEYFARYLWGIEGLPHWGKQNDEHYTYASRMREPIDQIQLAIDRIVANPNDRQIRIMIARPEDISKVAPLIDGHQVLDGEGKPAKWEPPCLTYIDLDIDVQEMTINLDVYFRSWDCLAGFPSNLAGLQLFNEQIVCEVNENIALYNGLSDKDNKDIFKTGKIIARSKNLHLYERQIQYLSKEKFKYIKDSRRMKVW